MTRLFNALIGINILVPWIVSLILPIESSLLLNEVVFFACVFFLAIGNARIARLVPDYRIVIWGLSIANLLAAAILNTPAAATAIPILLVNIG